ncbi:MAG TPA: hypothetical protein DGG94_05465 [Micromonosporaceae bacterium]|nr:hypothetical protein [Micromonosporaceae bacterium]HCU49248.1 hypothetical protein [Micromonosporaceae bacterium]
MRARRWGRTGLSLVTAVTFTVAGCGLPQAKADPAPSTAAPADVKADFKAAAAKLGEQSFQAKTMLATGQVYTLTNTVADPAAGRARAEIEVRSDKGDDAWISFVSIDDDYWIQLSDVDSNGKWLHAKVSQLPAGSKVDSGSVGDPAGAKRFGESVVSVQRMGDRAFKGTVDLTGALGNSGSVLDKFGPNSTSVPFTAITDPVGRLEVISVDLRDLIGGGTLSVHFTAIGSPVDISAPSRMQVVEAPKSALQSF